jgi:AcrR family transcriptional regulator
MAKSDARHDKDVPRWRQRAVSRSLSGARSRAEQRIQRLLDAAFELIDEKGTADFTIQEVVDRSKQSLRGFYQYFDGKDELLLALFEETIGESVEDLRKVSEAESKPLERLRAFTIRLHEWCEPTGAPRKRGTHNRRPISEFSLHLAIDHPERVTAAMTPVWRMLLELLDGAVAAGVIQVSDTRRTAVLMQQTVMFSWLGNRLVQNPRLRVTAEETWEFCLRGLHA